MAQNQMTFPFYEVKSFGTTLAVSKKLNDVLSVSSPNKVIYLVESTGKVRLDMNKYHGGDLS